jgi:hypothetical protein
LKVLAPVAHANKRAFTRAASLAGQLSPVVEREVVEPEKKSGVPAVSVPRFAAEKALALTLCPPGATVIEPRVVVVIAHRVAQETALGEIRNVFVPGAQTNVGVVMSVAAFVGHPVPEIVKVLPLVVKNSGVPAASAPGWEPIAVTVKTFVAMPVTAKEPRRKLESDVEEGLSHFPGYVVLMQPQYVEVSP